MNKKTLPPFAPLALLFCLLLVTMPLLFLVLPKQEYSEEERRVLHAAPVFSMDNWSDDTEGYLSDHLPFRKILTGIHAKARNSLGLCILSDVWRLPSGRLVEAPLVRNDERMLANVQKMADFAAQEGLPFFLLPVPAAGSMSKEMPFFPYPDAALLTLLSKQEGGTVLDVSEALREENTAFYYATDPHWNGQGVYRAYRQIAPALGFVPLEESAFSVTESSGFYGTCYTRAALWELPADTLTLWDSGARVQVTLDGMQAQNSLFYPEHLSGGDQYPVFLDGNHGLTQIENIDAPDAPNLLILKDSFANSLVPLLVPHYHIITLVDLRAYRGEVSALVEAGDYQALLSVYSLTRLSEDTNLAWLR